MLTALLVAAHVLFVVIGVTGIVGGVAMMFDDDACLLSWWLGWNAVKGGTQILLAIVPAILEAIADANK